MDIGSIKSENTTVEIKHPATGDVTGLVWQLRPMFSPEVKKVTRRITDAAMKLRARGKSFDADDIEKNTNDILVAASAGWEWGKDASYEGKKLEFNETNVRLVLKADWISAQLDEALGETARFFQT